MADAGNAERQTEQLAQHAGQRTFRPPRLLDRVGALRPNLARPGQKWVGLSALVRAITGASGQGDALAGQAPPVVRERGCIRPAVTKGARGAKSLPLILYLLCTTAGCAPSSAPHVALPYKPLRPLKTVDVVDMGVVPAGGSQRLVVAVTNQSQATYRLDNIQPDCTCLSFSRSRTVLKPFETSYLTVRLDLRGQPESLGRMLSQVRGFDQLGKEIITFDVRALIVPWADFYAQVALVPAVAALRSAL